MHCIRWLLLLIVTAELCRMGLAYRDLTETLPWDLVFLLDLWLHDHHEDPTYNQIDHRPT